MSASATIDFDQIQSTPAYIMPEPVDYSNRWKLIPILDGMTRVQKDTAHRLNALGSSYYFGKIVLRKHRFQEYLHKEWCELIEADIIKSVIEIPRDHFKSTIFSEMAPIWWALPFTVKDEFLMRKLGYDDRWIAWMKRAHDQDTRTLLVSENIKNACKLGRRINFQYKNNDFFRRLFPEIMPDGSCDWSIETMTHKRSNRSTAAQGEGTYDFLGVDGALQSRHYNRVVQDDLVGKAALKSELDMVSTIEYHKLLVGAFDSDPSRPESDNDEIVVGNRWSYKDLNYHIKENEKRFKITNHSALGGCCTKHPLGTPIFPTEFSIGKLEGWRERLGSYFFSCQFLNRPTPPGSNKFQEKWLRKFKYVSDQTVAYRDSKVATTLNYQALYQNSTAFYNPNLVYSSDERIAIKGVAIEHLVEDGTTKKNVFPRDLSRFMVADPNHAGDEGRARHAICITGTNPTDIYFLECWAEACSHYNFVGKFFELAEKWKILKAYLETVGAQKWLKFHLDEENKRRRNLGKWTVEVEPLKIDNGKDAKMHRIEAMDATYANGHFWIPFAETHGMDEFLREYKEYPYCITRDILDVLGLSSPLWTEVNMNKQELSKFVAQNKQNYVQHSNRRYY